MPEKESMPHVVAIVEDAMNERFPLTVKCSCAWQAHAKNQAAADYYKRHHESATLWLQATKGYQVGRV